MLINHDRQMAPQVATAKLKPRVDIPGTNTTHPFILGDLEVNNPLVMGKVDILHAQGIKGNGMRIALIDTGVDFRHSALGGCFGPGCKIAFGWDFITNGSEPLSTCVEGGHGYVHLSTVYLSLNI